MKSSTAKILGALALWWLWIPIIVGILYVITHFLAGGLGVQKESWDLFFNSNVWHWHALFWWYLLIGGLGTIVIAIMASEDKSDGLVVGAFSLVGVFLLILGIFQVVTISANSDKHAARYYDSATTVMVPNLNSPPSSLSYLFKGGLQQADGGCKESATSDVPVCIKQGNLPRSGWEARVSSSQGALTVMNRTSGTSQNVDLLTDSLTYLNANGKHAVWSAIRDGKGAITPTEGVVEWNGQETTPTECYFKGKYEINKAIWGAKANSLSNVLANKYPTMFWKSANVYGFCKGNEPVIVFEMEEQQSYNGLQLTVPAGAVLVTGSPSGDPVFTYESHSDNLPGGAYPITEAATQRQDLNWIAGRKWMAAGFGFDTSSASANAANDSEYLLKSNANGHLYWVTPLTLSSSNSDLFVAYVTVRADTVTAGHLNPATLYVLNSNDNRVINIDNLEASARDFVSQQNPGFFSSGGSLIEYTPVDGNEWRAFGEINGRVVYRLDIAADNSVAPVLTNLETFTGTTPGSGKAQANPTQVCGTPVAQLSQAQILTCAQAFVNGLKTGVTAGQ